MSERALSAQGRERSEHVGVQLLLKRQEQVVLLTDPSDQTVSLDDLQHPTKKAG